MVADSRSREKEKELVGNFWKIFEHFALAGALFTGALNSHRVYVFLLSVVPGSLCILVNLQGRRFLPPLKGWRKKGEVRFLKKQGREVAER